MNIRILKDKIAEFEILFLESKNTKDKKRKIEILKQTAILNDEISTSINFLIEKISNISTEDDGRFKKINIDIVMNMLENPYLNFDELIDLTSILTGIYNDIPVNSKIYDNIDEDTIIEKRTNNF